MNTAGTIADFVGRLLLVAGGFFLGWAFHHWVLEPDLGKPLAHFFWIFAFGLWWQYNATEDAMKKETSRILEAIDSLKNHNNPFAH